MTRRGLPIVISAASGTGKTSLCIRLLETLNHITRSVSFTTRAPRGAEVNGRDYYFIDDAEFDRMIKNDEFIEWAEVFGKRYGTGLQALESQLEEGLDVLLDIDVQGGKQMRRRVHGSLMVFLLPPSMDELRRRLINRATESPDAIERRLAEARAEIEECDVYDYLVVNDDFEKAASDLRAIVTAARLNAARPTALVDELLRSR
ncbi:MAG: guanylate kinase [Myxococcota bacterium]